MKNNDMNNEKFANKYRIESARATWHDYNGGVYFVTICTKNMEHYFGEIAVNGNNEPQMILSEIGKCVDECIRKIETLHDNVFVPLYVVMPNHVHLILIIDGTHHVETRQWHVSTTETTKPTETTDNSKNEKMQKIAQQQSILSKIINKMKGFVTKYTRQNHIDFAWQPRFHDRIIRNHNEMNRIAEYIENNVAKWHEDEYNNIEK